MNILAKVSEKLRRAVADRDAQVTGDAQAELDQCEWLFVEDIGESEELHLVVILAAGQAGPERPLIISGVDLGMGRNIAPAPDSRRFVVEFERHSLISYMVMNESFGKYPQPPEEFTGKRYRVFSRSHLLDFTAANTQGVELISGSMQHFEIATENHVIDVIATKPPRITIMSSQ